MSDRVQFTVMITPEFLGKAERISKVLKSRTPLAAFRANSQIEISTQAVLEVALDLGMTHLLTQLNLSD